MGTQQPNWGAARQPDVTVLGRGEQILVVEEDEDVHEYIESALAALGYLAAPAADARSALEILAEQPGLTLLLTDVGLPHINAADWRAITVSWIMM